MKKILLFVITILIFQCSFATTYYWVGGTSDTFGSATSFSTIGVGGAATGSSVTFTASDELIFDGTDISSAAGLQTGNINVSITVGTYNLGQVKFINNVNVTLTPPGLTTWNINGLAGSDDWVIDNTATVAGATGVFNIVLSTGATGLVNGNFTLGATGNAQHITTPDAGAIIFGAGAVFTQNCASPFGTAGTTGGVVFQRGATFLHLYGANAFQTTGGLVAFQHGSLYKITGLAITPTMTGRVYGNFEYAAVSNVLAIGTGGYSIDTLTVSAGKMALNTTGTCLIKGDVIAKGTGILQIGTGSGNVTFQGTTAQTISAVTGASLIINNNVIVNNAGGVVKFQNGAEQDFADITVNTGDTIALPLTFTAGTVTVNGTFRANDSTACTTASFVYGSNSTLLFHNDQNWSPYTPPAVIFPAVNGPHNVLVTGATTVIFDQPRTVTGLFRNEIPVGGMNNMTINGILELAAPAASITGSPVYGPSSILRYNNYQASAGDEWLANVSVAGTPGYPSQVQLINNAAVPTYTINPTARYVAGDLTIDATSYLDTYGATRSLSVSGNFSNAGSFRASNISGGDLACYNNFTNTGTIDPGSRSILFLGSTGDQTISTGAAVLYNIFINKPSGNLVLGSDVALSNLLTFNSGKVVMGNYNLATAAITGGGVTAFAATTGTGALTIKAVGTTPVLFPVGNSLTNYTPITIANGNGDDFSVKVKNTFDAPVLDPTKVVNLQWTVSKTGTQAGNNVTLSPQWNAGDEGTYVRTNATYLGHYNGSAWEEKAAALPTGSNPYTTTITGVSSFSPFGIGNRNGFGAALLAVDFVSATAVRTDCNINVKWTTANEINTSRYETEVSKDGRNFMKVATMAAQGNSNYHTSFAITTALQSAVLFIRVKQIDKNGNYTYSNIFTSEGSCNAATQFALTAYPNPVQAANTITVAPLNGVFNGSYRFTIIDLSGKQYRQQLVQLNGTGSYVLPLGHTLAAGKYIIKVQQQDDGKQATVPFEKL